MKRDSWKANQLEKMRARFQKCDIAVNEPPPADDRGIEISPDLSPIGCRVMVYEPGFVFYVLRLRLWSDDPHRVISGFFIEAPCEAVRVLEAYEQIHRKRISWDPEMEDILNNRKGQPFGPTLAREGLLLGEGLKSPAATRQHRWALITVGIFDQFENLSEVEFHVQVHDDTSETAWRGYARTGGGAFEPEEGEVSEIPRESDPVSLNSAARTQARSEATRNVRNSPDAATDAAGDNSTAKGSNIN